MAWYQMYINGVNNASFSGYFPVINPTFRANADLGKSDWNDQYCQTRKAHTSRMHSIHSEPDQPNRPYAYAVYAAHSVPRQRSG